MRRAVISPDHRPTGGETMAGVEASMNIWNLGEGEKGDQRGFVSVFPSNDEDRRMVSQIVPAE